MYFQSKISGCSMSPGQYLTCISITKLVSVQYLLLIDDLNPHTCFMSHARYELILQPGHYLGHLIGHEGPGSLLSELKKRGLLLSECTYFQFQEDCVPLISINSSHAYLNKLISPDINVAFIISVILDDDSTQYKLLS